MSSGFRQYILDIMNDRARGTLSSVVRGALILCSYLYGMVIYCNDLFYRIKVARRHRVAGKVYSVGNITLGGTGKTPFVIMLSRHLSKKDGTAVLIRGYGEDEWKMLEDKLRNDNIGVFVGRDRVRSAKMAIESGVKNLVLDDGFQHRRIGRDIDIILLDATNPFGNRRLFPRGTLREPIASLKRADSIVITKSDKGADNISALKEEISRLAPHATVAKAIHIPRRIFAIKTGASRELNYLKGKKVCTVSAICDPSYFKYSVEKTGAILELSYDFPDHYLYREGDIAGVLGECKKRDIDTVVTTEKDAVKLRYLNALNDSGVEVLALEIELEIAEGTIDALLR